MRYTKINLFYGCRVAAGVFKDLSAILLSSFPSTEFLCHLIIVLAKRGVASLLFPTSLQSMFNSLLAFLLSLSWVVQSRCLGASCDHHFPAHLFLEESTAAQERPGWSYVPCVTFLSGQGGKALREGVIGLYTCREGFSSPLQTFCCLAVPVLLLPLFSSHHGTHYHPGQTAMVKVTLSALVTSRRVGETGVKVSLCWSRVFSVFPYSEDVCWFVSTACRRLLTRSLALLVMSVSCRYCLSSFLSSLFSLLIFFCEGQCPFRRTWKFSLSCSNFVLRQRAEEHFHWKRIGRSESI